MELQIQKLNISEKLLDIILICDYVYYYLRGGFTSPPAPVHAREKRFKD